jgi:dTDP-4-amino-4,6-dideoxygalactose transaminase
MIKLFQLDRIWSEIKRDALRGMDLTASEGWAQKGPTVQTLEQWLCDYSYRKHAITVASCTDALRCILAYKFPKLSRIGVPSYTFIATANAIKQAGHMPVFLDVNDDYHVKLDNITGLDGIVAVDLFGLAQDYDRLNTLNIPFIMDAAQSIETIDQQGRHSLAQGFASAVSFAPTKTIPAFGSGGAVLTDDDDFAAWARKWRTHGKNTNSDMSIDAGANSMIGSLEAVQILTCIARHNDWRDRRQVIAENFITNIISQRLTAPTSRGQHTWHKFIIKCDSPKTTQLLKDHLSNNGIDSQPYYQLLIHEENLYADGSELPNSKWLSERSLGIPCQHTLTHKEIKIIANALRTFE